jgi:hypothetical protein
MKTLLALILLTGCGSALTTAARTIDAAAVFNRATAEMMADINEQKQDAIEFKMMETHDWLRADKDRAEWRGKRNKVRQAQAVLHAAIVGASAGVTVAAKSKKLNLNELIKPVLDAAIALKDALSSFGIAMPTGGLF